MNIDFNKAREALAKDKEIEEMANAICLGCEE